MHTKTIDGITQQTKMGALMTILAVVIVAFLASHEVFDYLKKDVDSLMVIDGSVGHEAVRLEFDVLFYKVPCDRVSFVQEATRGTIHTYEPERVEKTPYTDPSDERAVGCQVSGWTVTDKVSGYFSFKIAPQLRNPDMHLQWQQQRRFREVSENVIVPDLSHRVNKLMFLDAKPQASRRTWKAHGGWDDLEENTLNGVETRVESGASTGLYHYALQVVPLKYTTLGRREKRLNQYSVTERAVEYEPVVTMGVSVGGQFFRDMSVVFTYDFYPLMLAVKESRESFFEFLANLFGIVGGAVTIFALADSLLHRVGKSYIGKKD